MRSRFYPGVPPTSSGQVIGLFGGSFNPAHSGHRAISMTAIHRLGLSRLWWLVSPGNPLKSRNELASFADRIDCAAKIADHPRIDITGLEGRHQLGFTADLAEFLTDRLSSVRFIWVMGGDNLAQFHRWDRWRLIAGRFPIAVINRPGWLSAINSPAGHALAQFRIPETAARSLAYREPPIWTYLTAPRTKTSSSALRAARSGSFPGSQHFRS